VFRVAFSTCSATLIKLFRLLLLLSGPLLDPACGCVWVGVGECVGECVSGWVGGWVGGCTRCLCVCVCVCACARACVSKVCVCIMYTYTYMQCSE
jgi:hypothetical protein